MRVYNEMKIDNWFMVSRHPLSFLRTYAKFYACFDGSLSYKLLCTTGPMHKNNNDVSVNVFTSSLYKTDK